MHSRKCKQDSMHERMINLEMSVIDFGKYYACFVVPMKVFSAWRNDQFRNLWNGKWKVWKWKSMKVKKWKVWKSEKYASEKVKSVKSIIYHLFFYFNFSIYYSKYVKKKLKSWKVWRREKYTSEKVRKWKVWKWKWKYSMHERMIHL